MRKSKFPEEQKTTVTGATRKAFNAATGNVTHLVFKDRGQELKAKRIK